MTAPGESPRPASPFRVAPIEAPTLESVKPLPPDDRPAIEPYRVLFPIGAMFAIGGVLPWSRPGSSRARGPGCCTPDS